MHDPVLHTEVEVHAGHLWVVGSFTAGAEVCADPGQEGEELTEFDKTRGEIWVVSRLVRFNGTVNTMRLFWCQRCV